MKALKIIKIGGNIIDDSAELDLFLKNFANLDDLKILVHGGGKIATAYAEKMHIEPKLVDGRRITDKETLDLVLMVYGGLINKNIVANLSARNCHAIGMSGADLDSIRAVKRPVNSIDYGLVGDVVGVNMEMISLLLENEIVPVFCALTHDGKGQMLNTNADTVASEIAMALSARYRIELIFCFEKIGVLENTDDESTLIPSITADSYHQLKNEGKITAGMIPKIDNAFRVLEAGVRQVYIASGRNLDTFHEDRGRIGTKILK